MKFFRKYWFVIVLLIITAFLRFYKLSELFFFNIDEDWYSYIVRKIVIYKKPVLIGWEIPGGMYVPPVMYYFGAVLMLLYKNNPLGLAFNASLLSIVGVFLTYYVGKKIFKSEKLGLFAALFFSFSYLINIYSRVTLTIYLGPILALLTYLSLFNIIEKKEKKWFFVLAIVFIFATQEGSLLSLIVLSIASLIFFNVRFKLRDYLYPSLVFLFSFIPLFVFDLRHNFQTLKKFIEFFKPNLFNANSVNISSTFSYYVLMFRSFIRMLIPTGPNDLNMQILPCQNYLDIIAQQTPRYYPLIGLIFILLFVLIRLKKENKIGKKILSLHLIIIWFGLFVYSLINPGHLYEWFFVVLFPAYSFIIAYLLSYLINKVHRVIPLFLLVLFIFINLKFMITIDTSVGYKDKISAVKYSINLISSKDFSLEMIGNGCNGYGYRYLFTHLGKEPLTSYIDNLYGGWLYDIGNGKSSENQIIFVPLMDLDSNDLKEKYRQLKKDSLTNKKFGNLEVLYIQKVN